MENEMEEMGEYAVGVEEFEIEELEKLSKKDAKQVLLNTFLDARVDYDDDSTQNNGWRIHLNNESMHSDLEEKIDILLDKITDEKLDLSTLSSEAAKATGHANELGQYTNLSYFFFMESKADDHLDEIRKRIVAIEVTKEETSEEESEGNEENA